MSNPLVSIVIPVFNVEPYLRQCLDSVVRQSLLAIEIICVNDASTDQSLAILLEYAARDPRVRVIDKPRNEGLSTTRNVGMDVATGEYLLFIDSDDYVDAELCKKALACAEAKKADVVIYDYLVFSNASDVGKSRGRVSGLSQVSPDDKFALVRLPYFAWTKMMRTTTARTLGVRFPDGLIYEDALFHWTLVVMAARIALLPERLYFYRQRAGSICYQTDWKQVDRLLVCDQLKQYLQAHQLYDQYREPFLERELSNLYVLYDTIDARHRAAVMQLVLERMNEENWRYLSSTKGMDWRVRDFFLSIRGSAFARVRRSLWLAARRCYRTGVILK